MKLSEIEVGMRVAHMNHSGEGVETFGTVIAIHDRGVDVRGDNKTSYQRCSPLYLRRVRMVKKKTAPPIQELWVNMDKGNHFVAIHDSSRRAIASIGEFNFSAVRFVMDDPRWPKKGKKK